MNMNISLGQMNVILGEPEQNLRQAEAMVAEAAGQGSDLIVLPELWSTGYDLERVARYATPTDQGIFAETAALARAHNIYILGSCLALTGPERYCNTAVLFDPNGRVLATYSKIHLFRLMDEEQFLTPGDHLATIATPWGLAGLAICYDLRFPELFRAYGLANAQMVFLPSEWPNPRLAHWRTLLRARAIENQFYVIACNRVGASKGIDFFGHSCIIDPWGETISEAGDTETVISATIDLTLVDTIRQKIPVFADRRPELYASSSL
jgi:omega-amidase